MDVDVNGSNAQQAINEQAVVAGVPGNSALVAKREVTIINYGPGNLKVNFDAGTTQPGAFTVRGGNSIDLPRACATLYWLAEANTTFTAVGV